MWVTATGGHGRRCGSKISHPQDARTRGAGWVHPPQVIFFFVTESLTSLLNSPSDHIALMECQVGQQHYIHLGSFLKIIQYSVFT